MVQWIVLGFWMVDGFALVDGFRLVDGFGIRDGFGVHAWCLGPAQDRGDHIPDRNLPVFLLVSFFFTFSFQSIFYTS